MASIISASTTSATALNLSGDTTGVLQIATGATPTTAVTVDASQNVGIGTASPSSYGKFSVTGVNQTNIATAFAGGTAFQVYCDDSSGEVRLKSADVNFTNSKFMTFYTNSSGTSSGTERMRIDSSGNVGIGTASPGNKLVTASSATNSKIEIQNTSTASSTSKTSVLQFSGTDTVGTLKETGDIYVTPADNNYVGSNMLFYTRGSDTVVYRMQIDSTGALILVGSTATKASGTTWANPSDIRLKDNVQDFNKGLTELLQVNVKTWEYNGKGGTEQGTKGLGVIADEIMQVLPETVDTYQAKLNSDDVEDTDIKRFDATEITWLLVNAVKELKAIVDTQAEQIKALQGASV